MICWARSSPFPVSRIGPLVPYALLILILLFRPRGLMGTRET